MERHSDAYFKECIKDSVSMADLHRKLGYKGTSTGTVKAINKRAKGLGLQIKFEKKRKNTGLYTIPDEVFTEVIERNSVMTDVLEELGYSRTNGSMRRYIKNRIDELNISTEHYKGVKAKGKNKGASEPNYKEIFKEGSRYKNNTRVKMYAIRIGIIKELICGICGVGNTWNGRELVLQLDHVNGVNDDHRPENLRLLCPNCHSQTKTFSGRNRKSKSVTSVS